MVVLVGAVVVVLSTTVGGISVGPGVEVVVVVAGRGLAVAGARVAVRVVAPVVVGEVPGGSNVAAAAAGAGARVMTAPSTVGLLVESAPAPALRGDFGASALSMSANDARPMPSAMTRYAPLWTRSRGAK